MKTERWNVRECSVWLWKCNFEDQESTARVVRGVPPSPRESLAPAVPHAADHVQEYGEIPVMTIKTESDDKDQVTTQELDVGSACSWESSVADSSLLVKEIKHKYEDKIKHEINEVIVKQELDIGATELQPQTAPCLFPLLTQANLDPRPGTSSGSETATAPPCTTYAWAAPWAKAEVDYCRSVPRVPSDANVMLDVRRAGDESASKEQSHDRLYSEDTPVGAREENQCGCSVKLQAEQCDCSLHVLTIANAHTDIGKQYECNYCKYSTTRKSSFINHISAHTKKKLYKRKQCEYSSSRLGRLKSHIRTHSGDKPFECKQCGYRTSRRDHLKIHMRVHTGEKPYKCEQCEYTASQSGTLQKHIRCHTEMKNYKCKRCEYNTSRRDHLKIHMRTHTGEKPYKCKQCQYSTTRRDFLKIHMRVHTGEKPYKCKQCEYSASRSDTLQKHVHCHTEMKNYKCKQCEYSTSRRDYLKLHMRVHTGEKPYKCKQCQYNTSRRDHLKIHMRVHTGEKPYKCKRCEYSASRSDTLQKHIRCHTENL